LPCVESKHEPEFLGCERELIVLMIEKVSRGSCLAAHYWQLSVAHSLQRLILSDKSFDPDLGPASPEEQMHVEELQDQEHNKTST
jgi:hypothetical protein